MSYKIVVFFEDQCYGGPEEGGWWYQAGQPVTMSEVMIEPQQFRTRTRDRRHARNLRNIVQKWLDHTVNRDLPEISSVNSRGRYIANIVQGAPRPFPEFVPYYE